MALLTNRMMEMLADEGVDFEIIHHRLDFTAQGTAADTHTPGRAFAKCVVLDLDGDYAMAVIPAHHKIDFYKAGQMLKTDVTLAKEADIQELFPDCEVGAEPPFGNLYDMPVYVSPELADSKLITFNAGTHHEAVRMRYEDFARMANPVMLDLSWQRK
jgi:Ala-tRNA(Pro) deacylase